MTTTLRTRSFATMVVAMVVVLLPAPAEASAIYPPAGSCTASIAAVEPGGTVGFACEEATFRGEEEVTVTVTGEGGESAAIGAVRFAPTTAAASVRSEADGSLPTVAITLPANASGTYNIAAVSSSSAGGTAAVTVTAPAGALSVTGLDSSLLVPLLIGGGALLLAGLTLVVFGAMRRARRRD